MTDANQQIFADSLVFHTQGQPGKVALLPTKTLNNQRDLALAYSPGVAAPCLAIRDNPDDAYKYTAKGNYVAVITNGTAVLGLGNIGALAGKPVMEGKCVLFKKFAGVDAVDIEVDTTDVEEFVNCVRFLGKSWGGINLEDIRAPECFIIERRLKEIMDIPVFHDDQHGTAIITAAGILNALEINGKHLSDAKLVLNGAGAAGIACVELLKSLGLKDENTILCDTKGVIYQGRTEGMNEYKAKHASTTSARTLQEALKGADIFMGLSAANILTPEMLKGMDSKPIIFAMANPNPEITPELAKATNPNVIIATGRSDYPNQINNIMGFPYIFRGTLDVRAREINEAMKQAAVYALANLAKTEVPAEVKQIYQRQDLTFGKDYIVPTPFDPRLIEEIPMAIAKAAMESGVAAKPIEDWDAYRRSLHNRTLS